MLSASSIASVVVALAAILVVIRWPRPRADRRVLERRTHSLEALGTVVTRSVRSRADTVVNRASRQELHATDGSPCRHVAITVLGPVQTDSSDHLPAHERCEPGHVRGHHTNQSSSHRPAGPIPRHRTSTEAQFVRLQANDLPPDVILSQTISGLTGTGNEPSHPAPVAWAHSGQGSPGSPRTGEIRRWDTRPAVGGRYTHRPLTVASVAIAVLLCVLAAVLVRPGAGPIPSGPGETAGATPTDPAPRTDTTPPAPLTPIGATGDSVTYTMPPPFTLTLAAGDTTWVRVQTTGGEVLFEGTLAPNDSTTVPATEPLQLRVGNPVGLLAAADGRLIDHPRPPGQPITLSLG